MSFRVLNEFKCKVVELTEGLNVKVLDIAEILELHPVMVYRWRQEYREGQLGNWLSYLDGTKTMKMEDN